MEESLKVPSRYKIVKKIGSGGMASVYEAIDTKLERKVAIKVLHPHLAQKPKNRMRFHREATLVAKLKHPNIVEIYDYSGIESKESFIITELIDGFSLKEFLSQHPKIPPEIGAMIVLKVAEGINQAHSMDIIHRDIKPGNIMIRRDGTIKITDFGIAQIKDTHQMTLTGEILGSPAHMSPEHIETKNLDKKSDIFSLGTLLYLVTTGKLPFQGPNPHTVIKKIVETKYPDPLKIAPYIGHKISAIIKKCLKHNPKERYESVEELASEIKETLKILEFEEPDKELNKYFRAPEIYSQKYNTKIIAKLLQQGKKEELNKNLKASLDYFNRALAIDPKNPKILKAAQEIEKKISLKTRIKTSLAIAFLIMTIFISWLLLKFIPDQTPQITHIPQPKKEKKLKSPQTLTKPLLTDKQISKKNPSPKSTKIPSRTPKGSRQIIFNPYPRAVKIYIDDVFIGFYGPSLQSKKVSLGVHKIKFVPIHEKHYYPKEIYVKVTKGKGPIRIGRTLEPKPSILKIKSDLPAEVIVPGRTYGLTNTPIPIKLQGRGPEEEIEVEVLAQGYPKIKIKVQIRAGELTTREVRFKSDH
jgi:serine/threonine-protein kinase